MATASAKWRKVKSGSICAGDVADRHERGKDYLSPAEVVRLLDAAKAGRHGVRDLRLIQDYLGHREPRHTVHYTRTAGRRFEGLWR